MFESRKYLAVLFAVVSIIGLAIAPVTAVAASDSAADPSMQFAPSPGGGSNDSGGSGGPFPDAVCTDVLGIVNDNIPYDQFPWFTDLPPEQRPPGVPWSVITPSAVGGIAFALIPSQCDVVDPNNPPYDPREDPVAPDAGVANTESDDGTMVLILNGTLNKEGPGPALFTELGIKPPGDGAQGTLDPKVGVNDGEKDYAVDPMLAFDSNGAFAVVTDVYVFGKRAGIELDCFGGTCDPGVRGLPPLITLLSLPDIPSPAQGSGSGSGDAGGGSSGSDGSGAGGGDSGGESGDGFGGSGTGNGSGNGTADGSGGPGADTTGSSDDGSNADDGTSGPSSGAGSGTGPGADGSSSSSDTETPADGSSSSSDTETPADGGGSSSETDTSADDGSSSGPGSGMTGGSGDGSAGGTDAGGDGQQQTTQETDGEGAQEAAAADGSGLGILVAIVVFVLGVAALAPRD